MTSLAIDCAIVLAFMAASLLGTTGLYYLACGLAGCRRLGHSPLVHLGLARSRASGPESTSTKGDSA